MSDTDPEPDIVDSVFQDESEDEVFFGQVSDKEKTGKYSVFTRRRTLTMSDSDRRRSFEVPLTGNRNGSFEVPQSGLGNRLFDSIGSMCSTLGDEEKNGVDDVFAVNESLEKVSMSLGNQEEINSKYISMNDNNNGKRFESDIGPNLKQSADSEIKRSLKKSKIYEVKNHPPFLGSGVPLIGDSSSPDCFQPARNLRLRLSTDDFQSSFEEDHSDSACFTSKKLNKDVSMDGSHSIVMSQETEPTRGFQTIDIIDSQLNQDESLFSNPSMFSETLRKEEFHEADDSLLIDREEGVSKPVDQEMNNSQPILQETDAWKPIDQETKDSHSINQRGNDSHPGDQEKGDSKPINEEPDDSRTIHQEVDDSRPVDQETDESKPIDQELEDSRPIDQETDDSHPNDQETGDSQQLDQERSDLQLFDQATSDLQLIVQETDDLQPIYQVVDDSQPINAEMYASKLNAQETDDSQPIIQENLSAYAISHEIVEEILAAICIPIISEERLPTDNSTPIDRESLSTDLASQSIMKESSVTDFVLPASHLGEGSLPTDFLPLVSNESLSLDEMPPVIENYLYESAPSEFSKEGRISSFLIPQIETNEVLETNDDTLSGMESWNGYSSSSKINNSSGSPLEIERKGSRPLTDQLKISCPNYFNIPRSSQSVTALSIAPVEEPSSARNSSEMSLSEKSLLAPHDMNNFLSSTSDGHLLISPNTIADGLSPESRERMYSLMEDSNGDLSCDDSVFSNEGSDGLTEEVAKDISVHKEHDEDTDNANLSNQEHIEDKICNVVYLERKEEAANGSTADSMSENIKETRDNEEFKRTSYHNESGKHSMRDIDSENRDALPSNDDGDDCLGEILDVANDQLFDDSLFTLNDENSRRLSTIGKKICKKWKKSEKKSKEKNESAHSIPSINESLSPRNTVNEVSPRLGDSPLSENSPQFDNTADEMALYEMFGQDYDKTVENMTFEEKKELREKLDSRTEEDLQITKSNLTILMDVSLPVSPDVLNVCVDGNKSPTTVETNVISHDLILPKSPIRENLVVIEKHCFAQPEPSTKRSPNDLVSILSSEHKRVTPSPSTTKSSPWSSASPHRKSFIPTPVSGGLRPRTPLSAGPKLSAAKTPVSNSKASTNLRQVEVNPSPLLGTHLRATSGVSPSPLAAYLRDNKPPPLVHQVKAQSAVRDLESTLYEVDNETTEYACPLPEAEYFAPGLAKEHVTDATNKDYNIAEAYGQTNTLAKVTRHVGRVKTSGIHWGEELATDQSLMSSPSHCQMLPVGKSVLKKTQRDSGTFDESMMDVSVLETVAVKKIGRGKNKK